MSDLINFFNLETHTGNIATMAYDIDIVAKPFSSTNKKAPKFQLFAKTPRGRDIQIGGVWEKQNQDGGNNFALTVNTGFGKLNANLGRYPGQNDDSLMAVIPWD